MATAEQTRAALNQATRTPVSHLQPEISDPLERVIHGEITITFPYSVVNRSLGFILVESDFRLRSKNGKVRVDFHGASGEAVAAAKIGAGDEVTLGVSGAHWSKVEGMKRPDTLEWELSYRNRLRLVVKRAEDGEEVVIDVDEPETEEHDETEEERLKRLISGTQESSSTPAVDLLRSPASESVEPPQSLRATPVLPTKRSASAFEEDNGEYASPAFLKRSKLSLGGFWEGDLEDFDEQPRLKKPKKGSKEKRRSRFSMVEKWTYSSRTPSPEAEPRQELEDTGSEGEEPEEEQGPAAAEKSSPPMVDEGVQTRTDDKLPTQTPRAPLEPPGESPGPPSSPTPAGAPETSLTRVEERPATDASEPASAQPNPFAAFQPSFGQSHTAVSDSQASGFGSAASSGFQTGSGFASQAHFGAAPGATFGADSGFPGSSESAAAFGTPSAAGFGAGFSSGANTGSIFGTHSSSDFNGRFGMSDARSHERPASDYPEPPMETHTAPMEDAMPEDEVNRLYKANDFYSAAAGHGVSGPSDMQDNAAEYTGDFSHDIANNEPAFAPSQLEQSSWDHLTSLPPQSQLPESNDFDNPIELISSSPPRRASIEEPDMGEFEDQQPEATDAEQEEGEDSREQGYMQADSVPEDAPVDDEDSPRASAEDEYRDGGDLAGEDYDLRNYDDAQEDDVVESDDESAQPLDPEDPDQQVIDFEEDQESDVDEEEEEEELEIEFPASTGHGVADELGEFDAEGEDYDEEDSYGEEDSEQEMQDYDDGSLEDEATAPSTRAPAPPSSSGPVFIDLLSDSDDDEPPASAPIPSAAPLPTAARLEDDPEAKASDGPSERLDGLADAANLVHEAEPHRLEERLDMDNGSEGADGDARQPAEEDPEGEEENRDGIDTLVSDRLPLRAERDENMGVTDAHPLTERNAAARQHTGVADEVLHVEDPESAGRDTPKAQLSSSPKITEAEMEGPDDVEPQQTTVQSQATSAQENTQTSISFESQPRTKLDFAPSQIQQDDEQTPATRDVSLREFTTGPTTEEAAVEQEASTDADIPKIVATQVEVTEIAEKTIEQGAEKAVELEPPSVAIEAHDAMEVDITPTKDQSMADSAETRKSGVQQSIEQVAAESPPETQTLRVEEAAEIVHAAELDASVAGEDSLPTLGRSQTAGDATQPDVEVEEEADDMDSEAEYTMALEDQIMNEASSARVPRAPSTSSASQVHVPSVEGPEVVDEPPSRATRSRTKERREREINIGPQSLRSWDRKSMSSVATDEEALARAGSESAEKAQRSGTRKTPQATPELRNRSTSLASPQSIRVTRNKVYDDDPSFLLTEDTPQKPSSRKGTPAKARETQSSVAASAEPEDSQQVKSQSLKDQTNSSQSFRATRSKPREGDPSHFLAEGTDSQADKASETGLAASKSEGQNTQSTRVTRSQDHNEEAEPATPEPRKIRGEVTPDRELATHPAHELRSSRTPEPSTQGGSPQPAAKGATSVESSFVEDNETLQSLKLKLSKELRKELPDCLSLNALRTHLTQNTDVIGIAAAKPDAPVRAKNGPKDWIMEILLTDPTNASSSATSAVVAHLYRPHKTSLPTVAAGDIVLLRHFNIAAMKGRGYGLRSGDSSSWAVWEKSDESGLPQIKGPPVELKEAEPRYAKGLAKWWDLVGQDEKLRDKIERKVQRAVQVGKESSNRAENAGAKGKGG